MSQDWCDLCELPLTQCLHGAPAAPPPAALPPAGSASRSPARPRVRAARAAPARPSTAVTTPAAPRRPRTPPGRTPQSEFRRHVLAVLAEHPVPVERDLVLTALEERMPLTAQDRGITADGEVRWRRTVLKERRAMADDGLLANAGHGLWTLTAAGRDEAAADPLSPDIPS